MNKEMIKARKIFTGALLVMLTLITVTCKEPYDIKDGGSLVAILYPPANVSYYRGITPSVEFTIDKFENPGVTIKSISATKYLVTEKSGQSVTASVTLSGDKFSQTQAQMFADVPVNNKVLTENDLSAGDHWVVNYTFILGDGRTLTSGTNTTIIFTCKSEIEEGTYKGSQNNTGWFGQATTKNVTLTKTGDGIFVISDVSAGGYEACCGTLGYNKDQPCQITDICNKITVTGDANSQIVVKPGLSDGIYNPATKTLVVHYDDSFNDSNGSGVDLFSTFVKQ